MVVGVDEAGRGPLAGVVLACALALRKKTPFKVRDSKALSATAREDIFFWLTDNADFCVDIATHEEIDKFNILEATLLAFNRAIKGLIDKSSSLARATFIVDGNIFRTDLDLKFKCIKGADKKIKEVACASVVAKVARDHLMNSVDFLCPEWNFSKHKGYPTPQHFSLIKKHVLSPFHRRSFSPCSKSLEERVKSEA